MHHVLYGVFVDCLFLLEHGQICFQISVLTEGIGRDVELERVECGIVLLSKVIQRDCILAVAEIDVQKRIPRVRL